MNARSVPQFSLRPAVVEDAALVCRIEDVCMRHYAEALWGHWIPSVGTYGFDPPRHRIVTIDGADVGCLDIWNKGDHLFLNKLYLLPEARGRGIGVALLRIVTDEAAQAGLPLRLSVLTSNPRARKFYEREGWRVVEETAERVVMEPA